MIRKCIGFIALISATILGAESNDTSQTDDYRPSESMSYTFISLNDSSFVQDTFAPCIGSCKFLLRHGDRAILVSKVGQDVVASQTIRRSLELEEHYPTYELGSLGIELNKHAYLLIGDHLVVLDLLADDSLSVGKPSFNLNFQESRSGIDRSKGYVPLRKGDSTTNLIPKCDFKVVRRFTGCEERTETVSLKWLEFDVEACPENVTPVGLTPLVATMPKDVMEGLNFGPLKPGVCKFVPANG